MTITEPIVVHELRIELHLLGDGDAAHAALYTTDVEGQWMLVADTTAYSAPEQLGLSSDLANMVRVWLETPAVRLPAF